MTPFQLAVVQDSRRALQHSSGESSIVDTSEQCADIFVDSAGRVNVQDLLQLLAAYGQDGQNDSDINQDGSKSQVFSRWFSPETLPMFMIEFTECSVPSSRQCN